MFNRAPMHIGYALLAVVLLWPNRGLLAQAAATAPAATQPASTAPAAANTNASNDLSKIIATIRASSDPSGIVEAYSRGIAANPDSRELLQAYVGKMADLGMPELAGSQARKLLSMEPTNGVAMAIMADDLLRSGDISQALAGAAAAVEQAGDNAFVLRMAGNIIGSYDARSPRPSISPVLKKSIDDLNLRLAKKTAFTDAYNRATADMRKQTAARLGDMTISRAAPLPPRVGQPAYSYVPPPSRAPQNQPSVVAQPLPGNNPYYGNLWPFGFGVGTRVIVGERGEGDDD